MTEKIVQKRNVKIIPKHNAKDFFEFTKDKEERYELINGGIYLMASPTVRHQSIAGYVYRKLGDFLEGKPCEPFIAPLDVVLFEKKSEKDKSKNVFQPDVFVVCDPKKITDKRIYGAPDLVFEIVSDGTSMQDYVQKFSAYMNYGVKEYWVVNPLTQKISVYIVTGKKEKKLSVYDYTFSDKIKVSLFEDFEIDFKGLNL
jgi:Uma2 family endonuclease